MSCGVELSRCDECGREVPRFELQMVQQGRERALLCEQCRGVAPASASEAELSAACDQPAPPRQ